MMALLLIHQLSRRDVLALLLINQLALRGRAAGTGPQSRSRLQGYLAHKKTLTPQDPPRTLGIVLWQGPKGARRGTPVVPEEYEGTVPSRHTCKESVFTWCEGKP